MHCPKCGSDDLSTGGPYSIMEDGDLTAVHTCEDCGYCWEE